MASDDRSINIGRDAIGCIFVTGDHNRVFLGEFARIKDAYIRPWSVFERVRLKQFTGREWIIREFDAFVASHKHGTFILEAAAGLGKTAVLAHLVSSRGYVHHFAELGKGQHGVAIGLRNIAAQLTLAWLISPDSVEQILPSAAARPDYLQDLLFQVARRRDQMRPGEAIVLVIDALDEAGVAANENVLGLPSVLPDGVFLLVSQRPVHVPLNVEGPRKIFRLTADDERNRADMRAFLTRATASDRIAACLARSGYSEDEFVRSLEDRCAGVWIYLHYILSEIECGAREAIVFDSLPRGIWQYYARFWESWRSRNLDSWDGTHLPLLSTLAASQEDLQLELLRELAAVDASINACRRLLIEAWRPFITVLAEPAETYRVYHTSLRDFLNGHCETSGMLSHEMAFMAELSSATKQAHRRIVDRYLSRWGGIGNGLPYLDDATRRDADDGYGVRHIGSHLVQCGREDEFYALLAVSRTIKHGADEPICTNAWFCAQEQTGGVAGFVHDAMRAWTLAEETSRRGADHGSSGRSLGREARFALMVSSVRTLVGQVPPSLLQSMVKTKLWSSSRALAVAQEISDVGLRVDAICPLIPHLDEACVELILDMLRKVPVEEEGFRSRLIAAVAPRLMDRHGSELIEQIRLLRDEGCRAVALDQSISHAPLRLLAELVDCWDELNELRPRAFVLRSLISRGGSVEQLDRMFLAIKGLESAFLRTLFFASMIRHVAEAEREQATTLLRASARDSCGHADPRDLVDILALGWQRSHYLAEEEFLPTIGIAETIDSRRTVAEAIWALCFLYPPLLDACLPRILAAAASGEVMGSEVAESVGELLKEALRSVLRAIATGESRSNVGGGLLVGLVAPAVPTALREDVFSVAVAAIDPNPTCANDTPDAIGCIAPFLTPPLVQAALGTVRATRGQIERALGLSILVPYLTGSERGLAAWEAISLVEDEFPNYFFTVLNRLAPYLTAADIARLLRKIQRIGDGAGMTGLLTALYPYLRDSCKPKALGDIIAVGRAGDLGALAKRLAILGHGEEALDLVEDSREVNASAIVDLLPSIPDRHLARASLVAMRSLESEAPYFPAELLAKAAPFFTEALLPRTFAMAVACHDVSSVGAVAKRMAALGNGRGAMEVVDGIEDAVLRGQALALLAGALSGDDQAATLKSAVGLLARADYRSVRPEALRVLAPLLPAESLQRIVDAANASKHPTMRFELIEAVALQLPEDMIENLVSQALDEGYIEQEAMFRVLAPVMSVEHVDRTILRLVYRAGRTYETDLPLSELVEHASEEVLVRIGGAELHDYTASLVATQLSKLGRSQEALRLAGSIFASSWRACALAGIASHLKSEANERVIEDAVSMEEATRSVLEMDSGRMRLDILLQAARSASGDRKDELLRRALREAVLQPFSPGVCRVVGEVVREILHGRRGTQHELWRETLHLAERQSRWTVRDLLGEFTPLIVELGGEDAAEEIFDAAVDVTRWWP